MRHVHALAAGLTVLLVAGPLPAQNLLSNGDFDSNLVGWETLAPLAADWNAFDVDASPTSGSALLTNGDMAASRLDVLRQCIVITQPGYYRFIAHGFVPPGQVAGSLVPQYILGFDRPGCVGGFQAGGGQFLREAGAWLSVDFVIPLGIPDPVPPNATIEVVLSLDKDVVGGSFGGHFDAVMLLLDPLLFRNGFE